MIEKIGAIVFGVILVLIVLTLFLTLPVYFLWNWLMPIIFGLPEVTLFQALGLVLLSSILFKSTSTSK